MEPRTLYIVGGPIGNLQDITLRALEVLKGVDVIFAEDTRVTHKLLERYAIEKPMYSYREAASPGQVQRSTQIIINHLMEGKSIAYLSDAGTPGVSDPGNFLVKNVSEAGFVVVPIPGPSALASIISVSGFICQRPLFVGFLPKKKGHQTLMKQLEAALAEELCDSIIMYESPERIVKLLAEVSQWQTPTNVCMGRELTKMHEEVLRGTTTEVKSVLEKRTVIKGEISLVISKAE